MLIWVGLNILFWICICLAVALKKNSTDILILLLILIFLVIIKIIAIIKNQFQSILDRYHYTFFESIVLTIISTLIENK